MGQIIDGTKVAEEVQNGLKAELKSLGFTPGLAIVRVGDDPASEVYTRIKKKVSDRLGINCKIFHLPDATEQEAIAQVQQINSDPDYQGLIVQLPLPDEFDEEP